VCLNCGLGLDGMVCNISVLLAGKALVVLMVSVQIVDMIYNTFSALFGLIRCNGAEVGAFSNWERDSTSSFYLRHAL